MTEIRHIVFDIGRVLIHYDPDLPFQPADPRCGRARWFFENVCTHRLEHRAGSRPDLGGSRGELLIAEHPAHAENIRNFRRYWHEMVPHAYDDSVAIMERLIDAGHDVTMLTNFAADTFVEARARFPFLERPRGVTVSGEIGMIKPERGIYDHHAAGVRPGPGGDAVHRRQPEECRWREGRRMAGGAVHRREDARGGSQSDFGIEDG